MGSRIARLRVIKKKKKNNKNKNKKNKKILGAVQEISDDRIWVQGVGCRV